MEHEEDARRAIQNVLLCCFGEQSELSIEEGRRMLVTDGVMFLDRSARSIQLIRTFCDERLPQPDYDWLAHMQPISNDPVLGFDSDDLSQYQDANAAARRFVIENLYEVLFPSRKGVFD